MQGLGRAGALLYVCAFSSLQWSLASPDPPLTKGHGCPGVLVLTTCILCRGWGKLKPFCVPVAITLLMWLLGPISSACINPARAFGVAFVTG